MLASSTILSRFANRLFMCCTRHNRIRRCDLRRRDCAPVYMAAEVMEERALLSATFDGVLSIGNDIGSTYANDVATDAAGNSYVTGLFAGTVDFDQGVTHAGDTDIVTAQGARDIYVAKYAPDNSLQWVQTMGGTGEDSGRKIEIDGSGSLYVTGDFIGTATFGPTNLVSAGGTDGFVAKLNAGGTIQWARRWGTAAEDSGRGIGVDSAGNVYAAAVNGSSLATNNGYDILKFSSSGSPVWSKSIAAPQQVASADLAVDSSGNTFLAGSFQGAVDFDPSSKTKIVNGATNSPSGFVLKLDTNGAYKWVTPFASRWDGAHQGYCRAQSVTLDASGNVIVGGTYIYSVDFNPGVGTTTLPGLPGAPNIQGGFVTTLNSSGGLVWARGLPANGSVAVSGLDVDSAGSIYATGTFYGAIDLDPGAGSNTHVSAGDGDLLIVKLTAAGNYSWAETFGGTGLDVGFGVAVDPTGGVHLVGAYSDAVDFDPDPLNTYYLTNPGTFRNGFRLRLRQV